ncbi:MAG TPA: ATPase domain-containing protein [Longimicrobiales bacterium]|nr:ATPase domain-containing protein [Longimicrobiales bacterium]
MISEPREVIRSVATGVPGLDTVLGGGLPEFSLNVIAGGPGVGKTTLAQQISFAAATPERPALYFTIMGEPAIKLLRYQGQFSFFDAQRVGTDVQFVNLSAEAMKRDLDALLDRIQAEIEQAQPRIIVVDSFRTVLGPSEPRDGGMGIDQFVQKLALQLTSWEVTSFLIGEYAAEEQRYPVFTVADGVFWLTQETNRNSVVRKLQVLKVRGRAHMPGLHTFRMTNAGVQVFPRIPEQQHARKATSTKRHTTGIPGLDELLDGGIPIGDAVMVAGPAGSGKTTFATQFIAEGIRKNEPVVVAVFEEYPEEYLARARARSQELLGSAEQGELRLIYLRPLDLSVDEMLSEILEAVRAIGAERVVIDSLSGFEIALAPSFREDFRESLYRLIGALTATGVTVFMTAETAGESSFGWVTTERISFITDDVIIQRAIEVDGELRKVLAVLKMRGSAHSKELHAYEITETGAAVLGRVPAMEPLLPAAASNDLPSPAA